MWVPYNALGPTQIDGDREAAAASAMDREPRLFLVSVFVTSPWSRGIETDVALEGDMRATLRDPAGKMWTLELCPGPDRRLAEVVVGPTASSAEEAVGLAWRAVASACAIWSARCGRGLYIVGWKVADPKHRARFRVLPFRPSTISIAPTDHRLLRPAHWSLLRLYAEARRAQSAPFRLLAARRVLALYHSRAEPFVSTDLEATARGLVRREPEVSRLDLVTADCAALMEEPAPIRLARFLAYLEPLAALVRSWLVAEVPLAEGTCWFELGAERELVGAANLADLLAHRVLVEELRLLDELARARGDDEQGRATVAF